MRKFTVEEFSDFLRRVDEELSEPCTIVLIGGGAVGLKYKGTHATGDLDLWSVSERGFWEAVKRANEKATAKIPVQQVPIAEPPWSFEERLVRLELGLSRLAVLVPEAHDLVLMKVARGESHDLEAIEDLHRASPLDFDTLIERYLETRPQVVGSREMLRLNFLTAIERLFGAEAADEADRRTKPGANSA
jgi:hypothetical protein